MAFKVFKVGFARTAAGERGEPIRRLLTDVHTRFGAHLPVIEIDGDGVQIRDLQRIGTVWHGVLARLRDDAPHVVNDRNREREIPLDEGERIVDKLHFLYRERGNVFVWQINRNAVGVSRAEAYLSQVFETPTSLPLVMNDADMDRVMAGQLYELSFAYDRPAARPPGLPRWTSNTFDTMEDAHAAHAKFSLRAPRRGHLGDVVKRWARQAITLSGVSKVRVRLTDESDPIELFLAPLRDSMRVELVGRYPVPRQVFEELESAYDRKQDSIPRHGGPEPV